MERTTSQLSASTMVRILQGKGPTTLNDRSVKLSMYQENMKTFLSASTTRGVGPLTDQVLRRTRKYAVAIPRSQDFARTRWLRSEATDQDRKTNT